MRNLSCLLLVLGFVVLAGTSVADDRGWYVGADAGVAMNDDFVSANDDGSLSMLADDTSDTSYKAFVGYQFTPHVAAEAAYTDHGETSFTAMSDGSGDSWTAGDVSTLFESSGWSASVVGSLPVGERWTLFASAGIFGWSTTETFNEEGFVSTDENSGEDAVFGAGFEYDVGRQDDWTIRGGFETTQVDDDGDTVESLRVGAVRRF